MLPHAPHPRQLVLELRQLDLELALGAPRVLGEDVEDQLGAVDDPRLEGVLERPLLGRVELVVDDQHLGAGAPVLLLELLELALADVRAPVRLRAVLNELPAGLDPGRADELAELRQLVLLVRSLREHGEHEPALGLAARREIGSALRHRGIIAQEMNAETLAQRTLDLVDIPSVSREEAAIARYVAEAVPLERDLRRR